MTLAEIDTPTMVAAELVSVITGAIANQPRTLQTALGPSEVGTPCMRALIHKLTGEREPAGQEPAWLPYIGSCVHSGLESAFKNDQTNRGLFQPRFLTEHKVCVGCAGGQDIWGSADLFDIDSGTVVDWKIVGPKRMELYRDKGPGKQYRTQAHLYGRGFARLGYTVNTVMIMFLPRDGMLKTYYPWAEPYDESVATEALSRVNGIHELLPVLGKKALLESYPPCGDWFCVWCKRSRKYNRT